MTRSLPIAYGMTILLFSISAMRLHADDAVAAKLVGTWSARDENAGAAATLQINPDGSYVWTQQAGAASRVARGTFAINDDALLLTPQGAAQPGRLPFKFVDDNTLALQGPGGVLRMTKQVAKPDPEKQEPPPAKKAVESPGGYILHRCLDEHGFKDEYGKPLEAFRILVPRGWTIDGGVTWISRNKDPRLLNEADFLRPAVINFIIQSPKKHVALQNYPGTMLVNLGNSPAAQTGAFPPGSNYMGMTVAPLMGPIDYIQNAVIPLRGLLARARVVEKKELPDLAKRFADEDAIYAQALKQLGGGAQHQAAMVTIEYDQDGVLYREAFVTDIGYFGVAGVVVFSPTFAVSYRAPADEFDGHAPYVLCSLFSFKVDPLWAAMYRLTVAKAGAKIDEVRQYCAKIDAQIAANRAKTGSQINNEFYRDVIAPYKVFSGPDGKDYYLPNHEKYQIDRDGNIYSGSNIKENHPDRSNLKEPGQK